MRRVFETRFFSRWRRKSGLSPESLCLAVSEMEQGLVDADLGGGVVKKRVALAGRGKRGGARVLLATNRGNLWFFVFGFEKNERDNVNATELEALKTLAADLLSLSSAELDSEVGRAVLTEICHEHQDERNQSDPERGS